MLADGMYVMITGKYMGPEKPGPWARLFEWCNINVFRLGPLFVVFGLAWLTFVVGIIMKAGWANSLGMIVSILSLWYLPVGTLLSLIVFVLLFLKQKQS